MATRRRSSKKSGGLSPQLFSGLNQKRMASGQGNPNIGLRVQLEKSKPLPVQFMGDPDDAEYFIEIDQHQFQEEGRWNYVPCAGDDCPLCASESEVKAKRHYRFFAVIYNLNDRKLQVLEGPKTMAQLIFLRYKATRRRSARNRRPFTRRVYEITKMPTEPVSYDLAIGEDDPVSSARLAKLEAIDLQKYVTSEMERYYGNLDLPSRSALEDDIEDDDDYDDRPRRRKSSSSSSRSSRSGTTRRRRRD